jgi:cell division protein FtsB
MKRILPFLTILFLFYLIFTVARSIVDIYGSDDRVLAAKKQLSDARAKNEELKKKLSEIGTDRFVEKEARDKLSMSKGGETVVIMPSILPGVQQPVESKNEEAPNYVLWWRLFF